MKKKSGLTVAGLIIAFGGVVLCAAAVLAILILCKQDVKTVVDLVVRLKDKPLANEKYNLLIFGGALALVFLIVGVILAACGKKKSKAAAVAAAAATVEVAPKQNAFLGKAKEVLPDGVYGVVEKAYDFTAKNTKIVAGSAAALVSLVFITKLSKKNKKKGK